ncbi:MAG: hypothetical protein R2851_11550 [Caldilineaceae bacterium]
MSKERTRGRRPHNSLPGTLEAAARPQIDLHAPPAHALRLSQREHHQRLWPWSANTCALQVPDPAELLIVSCVDLHHVPKMFQAVANKAMAKAYTTADLLPDGLDPLDHADHFAGLERQRAPGVRPTTWARKQASAWSTVTARSWAAIGIDGLDAALAMLRQRQK